MCISHKSLGCGVATAHCCNASMQTLTLTLLSLVLQHRTDFDSLRLLAVARLGLQSVEVLLCVVSMF